MVTEEEIAKFRAALLDLRKDLRAFESRTREGAKPVDLEQPIGRLTRMDAIQQQKLTQATRHRNAVRMQQVDAALARIKAGRFGECVSCEEPIDDERLQARPETPLCLDCQEELEES